MARWLPYHQDRFFLSMQAALHGRYEPQFTPPDSDTHRDSGRIRAAANRALDAFSSRADAAIQAYKQKKRGR